MSPFSGQPLAFKKKSFLSFLRFYTPFPLPSIPVTRFLKLLPRNMHLIYVLASSFILIGAYRARAGIVPQLWPPICYSLTDTYVGADFQNNWEWEAIPDPTHGRVNYVTLAQAQALNLTEGEYMHVASGHLPTADRVYSYRRQLFYNEGRLVQHSVT